jgi:hypothetical protein
MFYPEARYSALSVTRALEREYRPWMADSTFEGAPTVLEEFEQDQRL